MTPPAVPAVATTLPPFVARRLRDCPAYRIAPADSNYFALVFDDVSDSAGLLAVVEIFEVGGRTPANHHLQAREFFFVLRGTGRACVAGQWAELATGDALMVRPGHEHVIENTGSERLYCLTLMLPDEGLGQLIRSGQPVPLDEADRLALAG